MIEAQNIYDEPTFWEHYNKFPRSEKGELGASEWPELLRILPKDFNHKKVLDLACGEGWFARWSRLNGAAQVDAMDLSTNMLAKAKKQGLANGITDINYSVMNFETLRLPWGAYDVVFCGLAT
ncbi:S-adenosyl-L-methionine-dependent methyltransferase [Mycena alexandri]|uniref:S-adenosyl-L-methionine-dependent methyltransferase n=1 Tax=Mycena alexandri TaxID=1745969 RepID=A0AAD6SYW7_9AGAR|nr:S-adenosyl-L-methionine-dependent methyltransferase [Mycena alexandri]